MKTELWKQGYDFPNNLFAMSPTIFELWIMKTEIWIMETRLWLPKHPLSFPQIDSIGRRT